MRVQSVAERSERRKESEKQREPGNEASWACSTSKFPGRDRPVLSLHHAMPMDWNDARDCPFYSIAVYELSKCAHIYSTPNTETQTAPKKGLNKQTKQKTYQCKGSLMVFSLWSTKPQPLLKDCGCLSWQKKKKSLPFFLIPLRILLPVSQLVVGRLSCSNQPWRTELV